MRIMTGKKIGSKQQKQHFNPFMRMITSKTIIIFEAMEEEAEDNIHAHIYGRKSQPSSVKAISKDSFHTHLYGKKSQKKQPPKVVGEVQEFLNEKRVRFQKGEDALS